MNLSDLDETSGPVVPKPGRREVWPHLRGHRACGDAAPRTLEQRSKRLPQGERAVKKHGKVWKSVR